MAAVHLPVSRFVISSLLEGFSHTNTIITMTDATNVEQSFVTPCAELSKYSYSTEIRH